jgi:hypothetical protein
MIMHIRYLDNKGNSLMMQPYPEVEMVPREKCFQIKKYATYAASTISKFQYLELDLAEGTTNKEF